MESFTYPLGQTMHNPASSAPLSPSIVSGLVGLADASCVFAPGLVIFLTYVGSWDQAARLYLSTVTITTFVTIAAFYVANLYKIESISRLEEQLKRILTICAVIFVVLLTLAFALKISAQYSRVWLFSWFLITIFLICASRASCYYLLRNWARSGRLTRNFVIVGAGEQAKRLIAHLDREREPWNRIVGIFDDRLERTDPEFEGLPVLGNVSDLLDFAREQRVDSVVITIPWSADRRVREIIDRLRELPVHVHLGADLVGFTYPQGKYSVLGGITMLDVARKPLDGWKMVVKNLEDRILGALLLILFAPLMCVIALAIKLDSKGPALFRQPRYGFNNSLFTVFKFRTMYDQEAITNNVPQARRGDPRITQVGQFLRRTSLDELPQLFNVLLGSMSLVGPRPHAVAHNEKYAAMIGGYVARHRVKPGITGWAQVNGLRGETDDPEKMKARVEHDIHYIENWSLMRDLRILARTAYVVWSQKNAY